MVFDQKNFKPRKQWSFEAIKLQDAFPNIEIKPMEGNHFRWVVTEYVTENEYVKKIARRMRKIYSIIGYETYILEPSYESQSNEFNI